MSLATAIRALAIASGAAIFAVGPASGQVDILVEYLDVPSADLAEFVATQREEMRPLHQRLLDEGKIYAWYDYAVRFPLGENAEYNHVVVTVFSDPAYKAERNAAIPYRRFIHHTEGASPVAESQSRGYGTIASAYSSINFLHVPEGERESFEARLHETLGSRLDGLISDGKWLTWALFRSKDLPPGTRHNQVIVARHASFADAEDAIPFRIGRVAERVEGEPTLVKAQLWRLLDIVCADTTCQTWRRVEPVRLVSGGNR